MSDQENPQGGAPQAPVAPAGEGPAPAEPAAPTGTPGSTPGQAPGQTPSRGPGSGGGGRGFGGGGRGPGGGGRGGFGGRPGGGGGRGPGGGGRGPGGGGFRGREGGGPSGPGGPRKGKRQYFRKKKVCRFCVDKMDFIDYKKPEVLQSFVQERGKLLPRRLTGTCARHQRWLNEAIKRARNIALLPFATEL